MTHSITVHSNTNDSWSAGRQIGRQIHLGLDGKAASAIIVFASSRHNFESLLAGIHESCKSAAVIGSSSAGEFTSDAYDEGAASAMAFHSDELLFTPALGRGLRQDREAAAHAVIQSFRGTRDHQYAFKTAVVLTDALAGHADDFVEQLTKLTLGEYQWVGGGAGDDAKFSRTHVFFGREAVPDAAVALEILSNKPIGIGVRHSWEPASPPMRVTEADGLKLISLNNIPAADALEEFAAQTGQAFNSADPMPFFLHNILGVATPAGFRLRVPLAVNEDRSLTCAAEVQIGAMVHIMKPKGGSALNATRAALDQLQGAEPGAALFFDCVATRLRMGKEFGFELSSVKEALGQARFAGCNTYGQIARSPGQFSGFHNCTAVVAVFPK